MSSLSLSSAARPAACAASPPISPRMRGDARTFADFGRTLVGGAGPRPHARALGMCVTVDSVAAAAAALVTAAPVERRGKLVPSAPRALPETSTTATMPAPLLCVAAVVRAAEAGRAELGRRAMEDVGTTCIGSAACAADGSSSGGAGVVQVELGGGEMGREWPAERGREGGCDAVVGRPVSSTHW